MPNINSKSQYTNMQKTKWDGAEAHTINIVYEINNNSCKSVLTMTIYKYKQPLKTLTWHRHTLSIGFIVYIKGTSI